MTDYTIPDDLIEEVAKAIYCDGTYRQYDDGSFQLGADHARWTQTSETQRTFCRHQADAAIRRLYHLGWRPG